MVSPVTIIPSRTDKTYSSEGLKINLSAAEIAALVGERLIVHTEHSIDQNLNPDTGTSKPQLRPGSMAANAADAGKRSRSRGVTREQRMTRSISLRKFRGKTKAKAQIRVGAFFVDWLDRERRIGARNFEVKGKADKVITKALDDAMKTVIKEAK